MALIEFYNKYSRDQLVRAIKTSSPETNSVVNCFFDKVKPYTKGMLINTFRHFCNHIFEEAFQEGYKGFRKNVIEEKNYLVSDKSGVAPETIVCTITKRRYIDLLRKEQIRNNKQRPLASNEKIIIIEDKAFLRKDAYKFLIEVIVKILNNHKLAKLVFRRNEGYEYWEIGEELGYTADTARKKHSVAIKKIQSYIEKEPYVGLLIKAILNP